MSSLWRIIHGAAKSADQFSSDFQLMLQVHRRVRVVFFYIYRTLPEAYNPKLYQVLAQSEPDVDLNRPGSSWERYAYRLHELVNTQRFLSDLSEEGESAKARWSGYQPSFQTACKQYGSMARVRWLRDLFDYVRSLDTVPHRLIVAVGHLAVDLGLRWGHVLIEGSLDLDQLERAAFREINL